MRVGPDIVTDPAFLVTRLVFSLLTISLPTQRAFDTDASLYCTCENADTITVTFLNVRHMEDFVTWVDSSKIKQHVMNYNEEVSDLSEFVCTYFSYE